MKNESLVSVVRLCVALDTKAVDIYSKLSSLSRDKELRKFCRDMAGEEREHVALWKKLLRLAEKQKLPSLFEDAADVKADLEAIEKKVDHMAEQCLIEPTPARALLLAYRLESHLLHPVFENLFLLMKGLYKGKNPGDTYEVHINRLVDMLKTHGNGVPEVDLLGETLQRLWKNNRELARQNFTDELTGVLNRRGFSRAAGPLFHLAQRNQHNVAVLMADIDNFKQINDRYGHQKGDEVLKSVAEIMARSTRASDVVGRFGGEEFIIFLSSVQRKAIFNIADKIRKKVEKETRKGIPITISIGVAGGVLDADVEKRVKSLIRKADACLYDAKRSGKNRVIISN